MASKKVKKKSTNATKRPAKKRPAAKASKAPAKKAPKSAQKLSAKKSSTKKASAKREPEEQEAPAELEEASSGPKKARGAAATAGRILDAENTPQRLSEQAESLLDSRSTVATKSARVLHEIVNEKPELLVPHVEKFARGLTSKHKRVVQVSADALPAIAKIAPARVAKHLDILKSSFEATILDGKDGLVRTFSNLCTASVAYQKRLEPVLTLALQSANGKSLLRWSEIVLPALKGEPHARARAVVEDRLDRIPRAIAQQIASNLNFKLRVRYR